MTRSLPSRSYQHTNNVGPFIVRYMQRHIILLLFVWTQKKTPSLTFTNQQSLLPRSILIALELTNCRSGVHNKTFKISFRRFRKTREQVTLTSVCSDFNHSQASKHEFKTDLRPRTPSLQKNREFQTLPRIPGHCKETISTHSSSLTHKHLEFVTSSCFVPPKPRLYITACCLTS